MFAKANKPLEKSLAYIGFFYEEPKFYLKKQGL
jgi:hypothetical protein